MRKGKVTVYSELGEEILYEMTEFKFSFDVL